MHLSSRPRPTVALDLIVLPLLPHISMRCPKFFGHTFGSPRSLTEPDKRISHTSGSSVNPSDRLYSTTWIQVFADNRTRPFVQFQYFLKPLPCIAWPLTLAVDPFKQDLGCVVNVATAFIRVIRYGVIVQMACYPYPGPLQHLRLAQSVSALACPVGELIQA